MMQQRPDPAKLRAGLSELLAAHAEIDFAYLFGSFADGAQYHDVDVAVFMRPAPQPSSTFDLEMNLSVEFTLALHADVDVHVLNNAPRGFQHAVLQGQPLLVRDEERLTDFIEEVGTEVMEFAYLAELYLREVLT
jgi:predicted nucleotidyltransferase